MQKSPNPCGSFCPPAYLSYPWSVCPGPYSSASLPYSTNLSRCLIQIVHISSINVPYISLFLLYCYIYIRYGRAFSSCPFFVLSYPRIENWVFVYINVFLFIWSIYNGRRYIYIFRVCISLHLIWMVVYFICIVGKVSFHINI